MPQKLLSTCRYVLTAIILAGISCALVSCDPVSETVTVNLDDRIDDKELASTESHTHDHDVLHFGFDLRSSPQEDARQYLPFLDYLKKATGYEFLLVFSSANKSLIDELGTGHIDIAAIGAVSYIKAKKTYNADILVGGLNKLNKTEYRSFIVVRPDSKIKKITELKGKRFAFGDTTSTQGHLIPRIILTKNGITLEGLANYDYTGSHINCANAVASNKFDACGMQDTMAEDLADQGLVRILYRSEYYPSSGIAVNKNIPPEVKAKLTAALLDFDPHGRHKGLLHNWHLTEMPGGFEKAEDSDYDELRRWIKELEFFESAP